MDIEKGIVMMYKKVELNDKEYGNCQSEIRTRSAKLCDISESS